MTTKISRRPNPSQRQSRKSMRYSQDAAGFWRSLQARSVGGTHLIDLNPQNTGYDTVHKQN